MKAGFWPFRPLAALAVATCLCGPSRADEAVTAAIGRIVQADLATRLDSPGGLAVAVHAGGTTRIFTYGRADQARGQPVTADTLFDLASVRKLFEATLVSLGSLRGELSLDDPASRYLPELTGDYVRRITIGQLVTHTSGLLLPTDHPPWPTDGYTLPQFLAALNAWTPQAGEEPGRQRIYTHAGFILLQLVLERRYQRPIAELITTRILAPLGMTETVVADHGPDGRALLPPEVLARIVQGYGDHGTPIGFPGSREGYYHFPGTGQMYSSARDLGRFMAACLDGAGIDPQLRQALRLTQRQTIPIGTDFGQAMAWENVHRNGIEVVDKPGGLNNATAYIGLAPMQDMGIAVLVNRGEYPYEIARYRVLPELRRLRGQ